MKKSYAVLTGYFDSFAFVLHSICDLQYSMCDCILCYKLCLEYLTFPYYKLIMNFLLGVTFMLSDLY